MTGGAGFIGGHLVEALIASGARVRVLDDLSSGSPANLPSGADFVRGSVVDESAVSDMARGCEFVFHLAAMVSVPASVSDPDECFLRNVVGTENVLRASATARVQGFVHTSSAAVYGSQPSLPSREVDPIQCESPYAASKACGEHLVQSAARSGRVPAVSLRLFNVFGPRQDPRSAYAAVISAFVDAAAGRRAIQIDGTGHQTRDFVPVQEAVHAFLRAAPRAASLHGECFNVGRGRSISVIDLAAMVNRAAGSALPPQFRPPRPGDVAHSRACMERSRLLLGLEPVGDLEDAIAALVACHAPAAA